MIYTLEYTSYHTTVNMALRFNGMWKPCNHTSIIKANDTVNLHLFHFWDFMYIYAANFPTVLNMYGTTYYMQNQQ